MELVKYTIKSWFITNREIFSLRVFKATYLALIFHLILLIRGISDGKKNPQCLRKLKCFKKLTKILLLSLSVRLMDTITWQALRLKVKAFML